jgi:methylmalonyl-CoA/ethylmalonyl-CoA epimerase
MVIDHIGIVVRSLEDGISRWQELFGYTRASAIVANTRQRVRVVFLKKEKSLTIKLLEPSDINSPVFAFARRGGGLHHICFRCDDLHSQISTLEKKGARLLVSPEPGEAFNNSEIAFMLVENVLNVEVIDTEDKLGWISSSH